MRFRARLVGFKDYNNLTKLLTDYRVAKFSLIKNYEKITEHTKIVSLVLKETSIIDELNCI